MTEEPEVEGGLKPAHPSSASDGPTPVTPPATETVRYDAAQLKKIVITSYSIHYTKLYEKTADVELIGYENVASGYISVLVQGDVAACTSAVEAA